MGSLTTWQSVFVWAIFLFLAWIIGWRIALALQAIMLSSSRPRHRRLRGTSWSRVPRIVEKVSMMQRGDSRREVMALLGQAADEMASQPPELEEQEISYLFETLGDRLDRETYRRVLERVQGDVAARLQTPKL